MSPVPGLSRAYCRGFSFARMVAGGLSVMSTASAAPRVVPGVARRDLDDFGDGPAHLRQRGFDPGIRSDQGAKRLVGIARRPQENSIPPSRMGTASRGGWSMPNTSVEAAAAWPPRSRAPQRQSAS
ncbi:hypothetical protein BV379_16610 [Rhodovulum sulfidophilum]|nr:hypothetical protein BV379_16610 [Rhodovulum sulfidophilum]